jgi:type II secretory pathway component PulF
MLIKKILRLPVMLLTIILGVPIVLFVHVVEKFYDWLEDK